MKIIHIIELEGFAGTEKMLIQFVHNNTAIENIIFNTRNDFSNQLNSHLSRKNIFFPYRIFQNNALKYPGFLRKYVLRHAIDKQKPDLIIAWNLIPNWDKKPKNGKVIYYDHGNSWFFPKNAKLLRFFASLDGCIAASYASQRMLQLKFNLTCPIETVPNSISCRNKVITPKNLSGKQVTLGIASRLEPIKALGVALLTTNELNKRGINTKLYIAGEGTQQKDLKKLTEKLNLTDKVVFLGFQNDLTEFYERIDFYISSSITESFGLSCMEALCHGIPVIFPITDGHPEVIKNGISGLGYKPTMTLKEYSQLTGLAADYTHQRYCPLQDKLDELKVPSYIDYANGIETIIKQNNYTLYCINAKKILNKQYDVRKYNQLLNEKLKNFLS